MVSKLDFDNPEGASYIKRHRMGLTNFMRDYITYNRRKKNYDFKNMNDVVPYIDFNTITVETNYIRSLTEHPFKDVEDELAKIASSFDHMLRVQTMVQKIHESRPVSFILKGLAASIVDKDVPKSYFASFASTPSFENSHLLEAHEYTTFEAYRLNVPFLPFSELVESEPFFVESYNSIGHDDSELLFNDIKKRFDEEAKKYKAVIDVINRIPNFDEDVIYEYKISATGVWYKDSDLAQLRKDLKKK